MPCPRCGYDLRGNPSGVCPECGEAFDPRTLETAAADLPWQTSRRLGRVVGFVRTVWRTVARPQEIARQTWRPVSYRQARAFQLACVVLAWLVVAPPVCGWLWDLLRAFVADNYGETASLPGRAADAAVVAAAGAGLFLWLLTATGVASYFFHPARLPAGLQDRAVAVSYYAAAPLALVPLAAACLWVFYRVGWVRPGWSRPLGVAGRVAVTTLTVASASAAGCLCVVIAVSLFRVPLVLLARGTHAGGGRLLLCGLTLLFAWPLLLVLFGLGLPLLVFYVELMGRVLR